MKSLLIKYFKEENIVFLTKQNKDAVLEEIIEFAASKCSIDKVALAKLVFEREQLASTGLEYGLAIPHVKVEKLDEPLLFIGICRHEISDYQCLDDEKVTLILLVVVAADDHDSYLSMLQDISRIIRDHATVRHITEKGQSPETICEILKVQAHKNLTVNV